jgi:hypothetical protein
MRHLSRITVALVSLLASSALLAQSVPPKPAAKPGSLTVAQGQPTPGGASSGASGAPPPAAADNTIVWIGVGLGIAVIAAASTVGNGGSSTTTHH